MKSYFLILVCLAVSVGISFETSAAFSDKTNGEFVTLSGKVSKVGPNSFNLKVGDKNIFVEMDDYNWDQDGYKLINGDQVVVNGRVDDDFLEQKKVEAGSVFVKGINTYFYANSDDEEDMPYLSTTYTYLPVLPENALVDAQGKVTKVNGRKFVLDTGLRKLTVNTKDMVFNPLDKVGFTKISKGDRVRVSGQVEDNFFIGKEIDADSVREIF